MNVMADFTATTPVMFVKRFSHDFEVSDGRTLDARIIPYDVAAEVADPPTWRSYREMFVHGAFARQIAEVSTAGRVRVSLNYQHSQSIRDLVGQGIALEERSDGLYGTFRMDNGPDGDKALRMINEGHLVGLSAEFQVKQGWSKIIDGVTRRLRAHLRAVALTDYPAYVGAEVLAVREQPIVREPEPGMSPDRIARLQTMGIKLPT